MTNEKMFFDQFKELLNESEEPKKHEASHTNLKNYMESEKTSDETDEVPVSDDPLVEEEVELVEYFKGEKKGNSLKAFDVYLDGEKVDTVFYQRNFTAEEVKDSLVGQDGFSPDIVVKLAEDSSDLNMTEGKSIEDIHQQYIDFVNNSDVVVKRERASDGINITDGEGDVYLQGHEADEFNTKVDKAIEKNQNLSKHDAELVVAYEYIDLLSETLKEAKGDMGEEVTREEMGDSLKGYEEGDLYDIIKFLKGYKAETISNAIEKMKKWKLDSFNESKLSREMGLNEAQEAFHGKQKSGEYVGSKKVAGVEVDYYVKYKVAGKSKTVDRFEARFGKDKDDVLIVSGRALTKEDKLFGHLYNKFSDKIKKDNAKETPAMTKKREENYKEFEDAIKDKK